MKRRSFFKRHRLLIFLLIILLLLLLFNLSGFLYLRRLQKSLPFLVQIPQISPAGPCDQYQIKTYIRVVKKRNNRSLGSPAIASGEEHFYINQGDQIRIEIIVFNQGSNLQNGTQAWFQILKGQEMLTLNQETSQVMMSDQCQPDNPFSWSCRFITWQQRPNHWYCDQGITLCHSFSDSGEEHWDGEIFGSHDTLNFQFASFAVGPPLGEALIEIKGHAQSRQGSDCQIEDEGGLIILHVDGPPPPTPTPRPRPTRRLPPVPSPGGGAFCVF